VEHDGDFEEWEFLIGHFADDGCGLAALENGSCDTNVHVGIDGGCVGEVAETGFVREE
jgi:hypothetical protein